MKSPARVSILFCFLGLCEASTVLRGARASKGEDKDSQAPQPCPAIYAPVCCDGQKEFDSVCFAQGLGFSPNQCVSGTCVPNGISGNATVGSAECPEAVSLVCCGGTDEYPNGCFAHQDGWEPQQCKSGKCNPMIPCPPIPNPVCCDGDQGFPSQCIATIAGYSINQCTAGACPIPSEDECQAAPNPVCCNGTNFPHICAAAADGANIGSCVPGACSALITTIAPPPPPLQACSAVRHPVCCNEKSFVNPCFALLAGFTQDECRLGVCH